MTKSIEGNLVRERVSPLVTFDIKIEDNEKFFFLISLVEQTYGLSSARLCWLRLALLCERTHDVNTTIAIDEEGNVKIENEEHVEERSKTNQEQLPPVSLHSEILGYIPNQYGKLLTPQGVEWIDLFAVRFIIFDRF